MKELEVRRRVCWVGIAAAAKRLGVTSGHLSQCLSGVRRSKTLEIKMRRARIRVIPEQQGE